MTRLPSVIRSDEHPAATPWTLKSRWRPVRGSERTAWVATVLLVVVTILLWTWVLTTLR